MTTRVTLKEVAARAGVSHQTVSNVLNGRARVSTSTEALVRATIAELGYQPNHAARALAGSRSYTVAFAMRSMHDFADPYIGLVAAHLGDRLKSAGYSLLPHAALETDTGALESLHALFQQGRIDGAIMSHVPGGGLQASGAWTAATVAFDHAQPQGQGSSVTAAYAEGMGAALRHLSARGARRIAFIGADLGLDVRGSREARYLGYRAGLSALGLPFEAALVAEGDWSFDSGRAAMQRLLQADGPPDAVIAANDRMAIGALREVRAAGLRVPEDLALIGFDDFEFAQYTDPPLTSLRLPVAEMAEAAADLLLERLLGRSTAPVHRELPVTLTVRGSA